MENYLRLLDKIDRFMGEVRSRNPDAFACGPGCADCCVAPIRVWRVEFDHIGDVSHLGAKNSEGHSKISGPRKNIPCSERETSPPFNAPCPERETSPPFPGKTSPAPAGNPCPHLDDQRRCSIYAVRPVVCRLWGAPLLFQRDDAATEPLVQDNRMPQRTAEIREGILTCCPLNFTTGTALEKIAGPSIVNMEIILSALAAINHVYCRRHGLDPLERLPLA